MEETIIKWSSKKIVLSFVLYLLELALLLWIFSFLLSYPEEPPMGLVALILFIVFLIIIVGFILYQRLRLLFSDKEYLKCTAQGFFYKPYPKKDWQFYSWGQVENFALTRIKGSRHSSDFYMIEVHFFDRELLKSTSLWGRLRTRFTTKKNSNVLKIPIYLLDVGLPKRVFETMSYFEREWRIQQNRQRNQTSKSKKKERFH
ncbi:hypothetical protein [Streptococcus infantis]|uniref:hypothetical protein n=1 Tax=Streptococcus infantis TaxID=68892 RepID=UPI001CBE18AE|nr:hypothetical protein [Streptococcus infantis]MBZ2110591.1 hypothetical protein [Streptococcus infantis]MBZ2112352.1 hypothetical protein [Streptococcus infantis]MBZ2117703.1 hypothetical protein [Streptococcus infantis]